MIQRKLASIAAALPSATAASLLFTACQPATSPFPEAPSAAETASRDEEITWSEGAFCGGIAAFPCPAGLVCEDNPHDDCDPADGGADCGGLCVASLPVCATPDRKYISTDPEQCAAIRFRCDPGLVPFSDECGCGCEPGDSVPPCGGNPCGPGEFCCNPSCGICAPIGGACIQLECD